jgi:hypothetical protein
MIITVIDDPCLIGGTVGTQGTNTLPFRHLPLTVFQKRKVPDRRRFVAMAKLIPHNRRRRKIIITLRCTS